MMGFSDRKQVEQIYPGVGTRSFDTFPRTIHNNPAIHALTRPKQRRAELAFKSTSMNTERDPAAGSKRLSVGDAAASGSSELDRVRQRLENLKECFKVSGLINSSLELDDVLENIMTTSRSILKADACSLMLVDEKTGELVFEVAQGPVAA